jgi:7-carboxy-7-deazaguanine synthase
MQIKDFEIHKIPIVEIFQSISGEGISAGNLVTFVRVAGCDLRCSWCDTKYSFPESGKGIEQMLPSDIVKQLSDIGCNEVICTGGEPLEEGKLKRYLPAYLASKDFSVRIETSGGSRLYTDEELSSYGISRADIIYCMDVKCPGSGMSDRNMFENITHLDEEDEVKFVVRDKNDLNYALEIIERYKDHFSEHQIAINFSPVFNHLPALEVASFLKENNNYFEQNDLWARLSLQIHKFIWPEHQRGV